MTSEGDRGYPPIHDVIKKNWNWGSPSPYKTDRADSFPSPNTEWIPKSVFGAARRSLRTDITPSVAVNSITTVVYCATPPRPLGRGFVQIVKQWILVNPSRCYLKLKNFMKKEKKKVGKCFDGLVVKTSRCGREDSGSTPGRGKFLIFFLIFQMTSFGI